MTRLEYEQMYGVKPIVSTSTIDTTPAPLRMTREEYNSIYKKPATPTFDFKQDFSEMRQAQEESLASGAEAQSRIIERTASGEVSQAKGLFQRFGAGLATSGKILGDTAFGVAKILIPESLEKIIDETYGKAIRDFLDPAKRVAFIQRLEDSDFENDKKAAVFFKEVGVAYDADETFRADINATGGVLQFLALPGTTKAVRFAGDAVDAVTPSITTIAGDVAKKFTPEARNKSTIARVATEIGKIEDKNAPLRKLNTFSKDAEGSRTRIAQSNVLENSVDDNGLLRTEDAVKSYKAQTIDGKEDIVRRQLENEGKTINLNEIRNELKIAVAGSKLEGADLLTALKAIDKEIEGLKVRADEFDNVFLYKVHDAKISTTNQINFQTPPEKAIYRKTVARAYKTIVENKSDLDIELQNKELSKFYGDIERLRALDGKRVEGGRLGKYTASLAGTAIGGAAGSLGGPIGAAIGGIVGGEAAQFIKGKGFARTFRKGVDGEIPESKILADAKARADAGQVKDLRTPDKPVGAPKGVPKTKEITIVEAQIKKNVIDQNKAIKAGDFTLVESLKEVYSILVEKLKDIIRKYKALSPKDKQGGFVKNPFAPKSKTSQPLTASQAIAKGLTEEQYVKSQQLTQTLRGTKGMTSDQIQKQYPNIRLTKEVVAKDVYGNTVKIPDGEKLTPYEMKDGKIVLQDGQTYVVSKNQFANIKGNTVGGEAKPFAPELDGTEETVKMNRTASRDKLYADADAGRITIAERNAGIDKMGVPNETKYSSYQLPDGKNYKEVLIKAPSEGMADNRITAVREIGGNEPGYVIGVEGGVKFKYPTANSKEEAIRLFESEKASKRISVGQSEQGFKSSHWDEPNVVSHLRLNERTYQGKKVTFMEELQSDWAREGRNKGFIGTQSEIDTLVKKSDDFITKYPASNRTRNQQDELNRMGDEINKLTDAQDRGIPNNPLLKNWQQTSVKRALKEAVDNDSEYFAWINGEQTSARYNLATQVKEVKWTQSANREGRNIEIEPSDGGRGLTVRIDDKGVVQSNSTSPADWSGKKLDEVLGKGLADKIMADEAGTLAGDGLKFGGEWANTLYDKQVGNIVKDLTGAKVEMMDMGLPIEHSRNQGRWIDPRNSFETRSGIKTTDLGTKYKIGSELQLDNTDGSRSSLFIITDILGDGKFKAVPKSSYYAEIYDPAKGINKTTLRTRPNSELTPFKESFDISTKTTTQQGIKLTPEIKAKIRGEALEIKTSGKQFEDATSQLRTEYQAAKRDIKP